MPTVNSSMQGKICMVTGANAGIGKATALELAQMGATVVMVCRDRARGEEARSEIDGAEEPRTRTAHEQVPRQMPAGCHAHTDERAEALPGRKVFRQQVRWPPRIRRDIGQIQGRLPREQCVQIELVLTDDQARFCPWRSARMCAQPVLLARRGAGNQDLEQIVGYEPPQHLRCQAEEIAW